MALIDTQPDSPAQRAAKLIREEARHLHSLMKSSHQVMFNAFWHFEGATPQQIADVLAEDTVPLFINGSKLTEIILTQDPNALTEAQYSPPMTVTPHPDGTVTLTPFP